MIAVQFQSAKRLGSKRKSTELERISNCFEIRRSFGLTLLQLEHFVLYNRLEVNHKSVIRSNWQILDCG